MSPALCRRVEETDLIELEHLLDALLVVRDARREFEGPYDGDDAATQRRRERVKMAHQVATERALGSSRTDAALETLALLIAMARRR